MIMDSHVIFLNLLHKISPIVYIIKIWDCMIINYKNFLSMAAALCCYTLIRIFFIANMQYIFMIFFLYQEFLIDNFKVDVIRIILKIFNLKLFIDFCMIFEFSFFIIILSFCFYFSFHQLKFKQKRKHYGSKDNKKY